jgi:hypothetical protein
LRRSSNEGRSPEVSFIPPCWDRPS